MFLLTGCVLVLLADPACINRLVEQLGADRFNDREAASRALETLGNSALPALQKAAGESEDSEVRRRAARLVAAIRQNGRQGQAQAPGNTYTSQQTSFFIPFAIDEADPTRVKQMRLFVSTDRGSSWQLVDTVSPKKTSQFRFQGPPGDGLYWFKVQKVFTDGQTEPKDITKGRADLGVEVKQRK
jgi:hypothetical protein